MTGERLKKGSGLSPFLINALRAEIVSLHDKYSAEVGDRAEEIRLRRGRRIELCFKGTSVICGEPISSELLGEIFYRLCGGSVYAHAESICKGYIRTEEGIRIGVCGRAAVRGGRVEAVYDISSLNIRIPSEFLPSYHRLGKIFLEGNGGMLIISPPGVGKTTVLRSLASQIGVKGGRRVALIDSRGELSFGLKSPDLKIDVLEGYPQETGIEIALRTMNPQVIVCDEIGSVREAEALLCALGSGVTVIASAHGDDAEKTVLRKGILELHSAKMFSNYVALSREKGSSVCSFDVIAWEDIRLGNG